MRPLGPALLALSLIVGLISACGDPSPAPTAGSPRGPLRIQWATYLGGKGFEEIREPLVRPDGALLIGARTLSRDMPVTAGAFQRRYGGGAGDTWLGVLADDGSRLLAATYFGGSGMERPAYGIALDPSGDVVFTSGTTSPDLPARASAWRPHLHEPTPDPGDGYAARVSGDLSTLRWCTYTGGLWPRGGLALGPHGEPFVVGQVLARDFPASPGALQEEARGADDAGVLRLSPDGERMLYATRLGGHNATEGEVVVSVGFAPGGDWLLAGLTTAADFPTTAGAAEPGPAREYDGWLARVGEDGRRLVFSTLLGGSGEDGIEHPAVALADGSLLVAGVTASPDFPFSPGAFAGGPGGARDGFVARLDPDGARFAFVRRIGGSGNEHMLGPVVAPDGTIWVGGATASRDFPVTPDALQGGFAGGPRDGFVVHLAADGSRILYATYLGGSDDELVRGIALGPSGEVYVVGKTLSDDFPVTAGALQARRAGAEDGFVVKLVPRGAGP